MFFLFGLEKNTFSVNCVADEVRPGELQPEPDAGEVPGGSVDRPPPPGGPDPQPAPPGQAPQTRQ